MFRWNIWFAPTPDWTSDDENRPKVTWKVLYFSCVFFITWSNLECQRPLVQERRNSIANALEVRLSCMSPSISPSACWQNGMEWVSIGSGNGLSPLRCQPLLACCQLDSWEQISVKFESEFYHFHSRKMHLKLSSAKMAAILSRGKWVNQSHFSSSAEDQVAEESGTRPSSEFQWLRRDGELSVCNIPGTHQAITWTNGDLLLRLCGF